MRGNPGNEVLNTTVTNTQTQFISSSYVQLLQHIYCCIYSYSYCLIWLRKCYSVLCLLQAISKSCKSVCEYTCLLQNPVLKSIVQCTLLCMHSIVFFKEKHCTMCTLLVYITEFSLKIGGGPNTLLPPIWIFFWGGGHAPPRSPYSGPYALNLTSDSCSTYVETNIYLFLSHKKDYKYFTASRCRYAVFVLFYKNNLLFTKLK